MTLRNTVFQSGSSLVDAGASIQHSQMDESNESDITRVAEFFNILRDRLQNELPITAGQRTTNALKRKT